MRKFLSSTAGASFNQEIATQTICVRKDCVELIYKVKPSVYVVVSMLHINDGEAMLFANWARYFDRLQNQQMQMPASRIAVIVLRHLKKPITAAATALREVPREAKLNIPR